MNKFRVYPKEGLEHHFKTAMRAFDPDVIIERNSDGDCFNVTTNLSFENISTLSSVERIFTNDKLDYGTIAKILVKNQFKITDRKIAPDLILEDFPKSIKPYDEIDTQVVDKQPRYAMWADPELIADTKDQYFRMITFSELVNSIKKDLKEHQKDVFRDIPASGIVDYINIHTQQSHLKTETIDYGKTYREMVEKNQINPIVIHRVDTGLSVRMTDNSYRKSSEWNDMRVYTKEDSEYHFKTAIKAFDPNVFIERITDEDIPFFHIITKLSEKDVSSLSSVKEVRSHSGNFPKNEEEPLTLKFIQQEVKRLSLEVITKKLPLNRLHSSRIHLKDLDDVHLTEIIFASDFNQWSSPIPRKEVNWSVGCTRLAPYVYIGLTQYGEIELGYHSSKAEILVPG